MDGGKERKAMEGKGRKEGEGRRGRRKGKERRKERNVTECTGGVEKKREGRTGIIPMGRSTRSTESLNVE